LFFGSSTIKGNASATPGGELLVVTPIL